MTELPAITNGCQLPGVHDAHVFWAVRTANLVTATGQAGTDDGEVGR